MKWKDSYSGWLIELIPLSQGYIFKCWMANEKIGISNNHIYPSVSQAMRAARTRAKIESLRLSLVGLLTECYENFSLSYQEYLNLQNSVLEVTAFITQLEIQDY
jgi:hypothetical protein